MQRADRKRGEMGAGSGRAFSRFGPKRAIEPPPGLIRPMDDGRPNRRGFCGSSPAKGNPCAKSRSSSAASEKTRSTRRSRGLWRSSPRESSSSTRCRSTTCRSSTRTTRRVRPPAVTRMKEQIRAADAILFVTPEHNRSIPAALKNAIDWASRPPRTARSSARSARSSARRAGGISTAVAQSHLRTIIGSHLDARARRARRPMSSSPTR